MTAPIVDPGHLVPASDWPRIQAEAAQHAAHPEPVHPKLLTLGRSAFPSVTGFVQCKYDGGPQPGGRPTFGVLHDAETPLANGYAAAIASYFTRNTNSTSAHFMAGPDALFQLLDTSRIAWGCGNGNRRAVQVEQTGYATAMPAADWTDPAGMQQMNRVAALLRDIHAAHGIGLHWMSDDELRAAWHGETVGGWATHDQCGRVLGGTTHTDPMPNYPLDQLMALANGEDDMPSFDDPIKWNRPSDGKLVTYSWAQWLVWANWFASQAAATSQETLKQVAAVQGQVAGLLDAIHQLTGGGSVDLAAVKAAAEAGAADALSKITITVNSPSGPTPSA